MSFTLILSHGAAFVAGAVMTPLVAWVLSAFLTDADEDNDFDDDYEP